MRRVNAERNKILFEFWRDEKTIDEASLITGIPRSTVGYYFKKFDSYQKKGKVLDSDIFETGRVNVNKDQLHLFSFFIKKMTFEKLVNLMRSAGELGDYEKAYYELGAFKRLLELSKYVAFTNEEIRALEEAFKSKSKPKLIWSPGVRNGKKVRDIMEKTAKGSSSTSMGSITENQDRSH